MFQPVFNMSLLQLISLCLSVITTFYVMYIIAAFYNKAVSLGKDLHKQVALLVIAHPDDECMFFGPSVLSLIRCSCTVYVLCLSIGNFEKLGYKRKEELRQSCKVLGIPLGNVFIIKHSKLPDNPKVLWSKVVVANLLLKYMKSISADLVLSFDKYGISSHSNHISVYESLQYLIKKNAITEGCRIYALETVNILRKYSSFLDVPASYIAGDLTFVSTFNDVYVIQKAMRSHRTQYVWFRKLYMLFSRYIYINTFEMLTA